MPSRQAATKRYVGNQLTALLDERFITQEELAYALGVHVQNVSRWCRNVTCPQKRRLRQIAEYFDVPPASLLEPDENSDKVAA
jgi:transcriptional regulator with XRE-family HTH domain